MSGQTQLFKQSLDSFFTHPVFLSAIFSLFLTQLLKAIIGLFRSKARNFREVIVTFFWKTGGMPSSHSALATAIATSIGFVEGTDSSVFILALFFALVVIRDAMGVRRAAGLQARSLNLLGRDLSARFGVNYHPVREVHGHTPSEVAVGILLGLFISLAFSIL